MSTLTWKKNKASTAPVVEKATPVFPFGGQELPDGSVRYRVRYQILCDNGGNDLSGVFWEKIVPAKASTAAYIAAHAARDEAIKRITQKVIDTEKKQPRKAFQWKTKKA